MVDERFIIITEANVEEMMRLAEDVCRALDMNYNSYNSEGYNIFDKYYREDAPEDSIKQPLEEQRRNRDGKETLLIELYHEERTLTEVININIEELLELLQPILNKAIGIFRKGTGFDGETNYRVAESVNYKYLTKLFGMRVRDMMLIHAAQKSDVADRKYYLLLTGVEQCHDGDKWIGIFDNIGKLKDHIMQQKTI